MIEGLALYGHPFSSYTWKALIALYANRTEFEFRILSPDFPGHIAFVQNAHPAGKFPILVEGTTVVIEATAIIEYLDANLSSTARFIPASVEGAVHTRMLDRVFDNYVMGNMQRVVNAYIVDSENPNPGEIEAGSVGLDRAYRWLENWMTLHPLPPHISLVSCAAAPSLFYGDWVKPIPAECPRVRALRAELLALPPVARCVEDARPWRQFFPPGAPDRD